VAIRVLKTHTIKIILFRCNFYESARGCNFQYLRGTLTTLFKNIIKTKTGFSFSSLQKSLL